MRVVVTRPQRDSERTAAVLRARGHDVLVASLMRVEPLAADLAGTWSAIIVTSANAPDAIAGNPVREALTRLPLFAVGQRSADAARQAGFVNVSPADGDVRDLMRMLIAQRAGTNAPLLYLAGEDRAADLPAELSARGIAAEMRVVYRVVTAPFPPALRARFERVADDEAAVRDLGVEMCAAMCARLIDEGVPGIHFITLNRSTATREVWQLLAPGVGAAVA